MYLRSRVGTVVVVLLFAACAVLVVAGQVPQQTPPRFRAGVELVRLDVSVLDDDRNPVRGLTADDFTILEDGKPQTVETFHAIDLPDVVDPKPGEAPWLRDVAPDVRGNADFRERRVVAIVVDDATPVATPEVLYYPALIKQVIAGLAPDDLAAVVFALNKGAGQDFTSDRSLLLAAVGRLNLPMPERVMAKDGTVTPAVFDRLNPVFAMNYSATISTLRTTSEYLADLPDRRKALVFVSIGIPLDIGVGEASLASGGTVDASGVAAGLVTDLFECLRAAQRANVNIYSFDPGGLRAPYGAATSADPMNPGWANRVFLKSLSESTGGFAVVDNNDPVPGIKQLVRENGSYYLLGYVPVNARAQGRFRKLEVRVNRPGVTVRARTGYSEPRAATGTKKPAKAGATPSALASAAAGIVPKADLPLEIAAAPFPIAGRRDAAIGVTVAFSAYAPMRATRAVIEVDTVTSAYSPDGKRRASRRQTVPVNLNFPGFGKMVGFELLSRLDLPPGRYQLRFAAETSVNGVRVSDLVPPVAFVSPGENVGPRSGSVYCDVEVPDFLGDRVALSGIALSIDPKTVSGPPHALDGVVPVIPTTMRDFIKTDRVGGFVRISQGGTQPVGPVTFAARVMNDRGFFVDEHVETLDPQRFATGRMADVQFDVPVSALAPGQYLLRVAASAGDREVRRDVRFTVLR